MYWRIFVKAKTETFQDAFLCKKPKKLLEESTKNVVILPKYSSIIHHSNISHFRQHAVCMREINAKLAYTPLWQIDYTFDFYLKKVNWTLRSPPAKRWDLWRLIAWKFLWSRKIQLQFISEKLSEKMVAGQNIQKNRPKIPKIPKFPMSQNTQDWKNYTNWITNRVLTWKVSRPRCYDATNWVGLDFEISKFHDRLFFC